MRFLLLLVAALALVRAERPPQAPPLDPKLDRWSDKIPSVPLPDPTVPDGAGAPPSESYIDERGVPRTRPIEPPAPQAAAEPSPLPMIEPDDLADDRLSPAVEVAARSCASGNSSPSYSAGEMPATPEPQSRGYVVEMHAESWGSRKEMRQAERAARRAAKSSGRCGLFGCR